MSLKVWNSEADPYSHEELADNFLKLDQHDHSPGKGTQIPSAGLAPGAVTGDKIAAGTLATVNLGEALANALVPTASVLAYAGTIAPSGFVFCDGAPYDGSVGTIYNALWNQLGVSFGGTGQSAFKVPDIQGRVISGFASGGHSDMATLGYTESQNLTGLAVGSRRIIHQHSKSLTASGSTATDGAHEHDFQGTVNTGTGSPPVPFFSAQPLTSTGWVTDGYFGHDGSHSHSFSGAVAGSIGDTGGPTDVIPYLVLNYIIKL